MYSGHAGIYNAHINGHNKHSIVKKAIKNSNIQHPYLCKVIKIMIATINLRSRGTKCIIISAKVNKIEANI